MARSYNRIVFAVNFIAFIIAIAVIGGGISLNEKYSNECQGYLPLFIIILGISLLTLSLLGIVGSCCRVNVCICIYLIFMLLLIIGVLVHMVVSFVGSSEHVNVSEYKLSSSPGFVEKAILMTWNRTEKCFKTKSFCDSKVLQKLAENRNSTGFLMDSHSFKKQYSMEIGCCQPPSECGFKYVNGTNWETPKTGITSTNKDCRAWRDKPDEMCYTCDSCKVGVIASTQSEAADGGFISIAVLAHLLINLSFACCALLENRTSKRRFL